MRNSSGIGRRHSVAHTVQRRHPTNQPKPRSQTPPATEWLEEEKQFARKRRISAACASGYLLIMQPDLQWRQVVARDARQDGRFVFAVRTTGIYCRPSCPSRRPRRDSVEFFPNPQEAERKGYRACLRCKPTQVSEQARYVARVRQLLDVAETTLTLAQLSQHVIICKPVSFATAVQAGHWAKPAGVPISAPHAEDQNRVAQRRRRDHCNLRRRLQLVEPAL